MKQWFKRRVAPLFPRIYPLLGVVAVIALIFSISINHHIASDYNQLIYSDPAAVPPNVVGLVPGTAKLVHGRPNLYYLARIEAAASLYNAGKIKRILVSGDNSTHSYDESTDMKNDLVALGVQEGDIYLDYAGFRTLDSIVRAEKIFGLKSFTFISQPFHCQRGLFIAHHKKLAAVGFAARDIQHPSRFLLDTREFGARVKAGLDVWLFNTGPKFLGPPIVIAQTDPVSSKNK